MTLCRISIILLVGFFSFHLSTLFKGTPPDGSNAAGPYPTVIEHEDRVVLVVQASAYTKYLGNLIITYDEHGKVTSWEGNPIYLDKSILPDAGVDALLQPWKEIIQAEGERNLGYSNVLLSQSNCRYSECSLGNFITDAMVQHYVTKAENGSWTYASIGIMNAGGLRTSLPIGNISYNDLATSQPFENTVDVGELQGKHIKALLEFSAVPYNFKRYYADVNLLQVSGLKFVMDLSQPVNERIVSLKVLCRECDIPTYENIEMEEYYRIAINSFLVSGGDGYAIISENIRNHNVGEVDIDVFSRYMQKYSPIITGINDRITIIGPLKYYQLGL